MRQVGLAAAQYLLKSYFGVKLGTHWSKDNYMKGHKNKVMGDGGVERYTKNIL